MVTKRPQTEPTPPEGKAENGIHWPFNTMAYVALKALKQDMPKPRECRKLCPKALKELKKPKKPEKRCDGS